MNNVPKEHLQFVATEIRRLATGYLDQARNEPHENDQVFLRACAGMLIAHANELDLPEGATDA